MALICLAFFQQTNQGFVYAGEIQSSNYQKLEMATYFFETSG